MTRWKPKFRGTVNGGKLIVSDPRFPDFLSRFEGKDIEVIIQRPTRKKSNQQNAYFHGVIVDLLAAEWGLSHEDALGRIRREFFYRYLDDGTEIIMSTSNQNWTTAEWEEKMEEIRREAAIKYSVYIPLPNEIEDEYMGKF